MPVSSASEHITALTSLKRAVLAYQQELITALSQDYGYRSADDSMLADILPVINNINYSIKHVRRYETKLPPRGTFCRPLRSKCITSPWAWSA